MAKIWKSFFWHFIRPEKKFDSVESLKEQIERDVQTSREYFEKEYSAV